MILLFTSLWLLCSWDHLSAAFFWTLPCAQPAVRRTPPDYFGEIDR